jgi:hypothetical protein
MSCTLIASRFLQRSRTESSVKLGGILLGLLPGVAFAADADQFRSVEAALREAARGGMRIIYSDALVTPDLEVLAEPTSTDRIERLQQILAPHSLTVSEMAPGIFTVTRKRATHEGATFDPLEEVRVVSSRYTIEAVRTERSFVLNALDMQRQPALFEDAVRSVRRFPGTAGSNLTARTFVRGGLGDENLLLLDGVPLHDPFHMQGLPVDVSLIDPVIVERVDFYSGVQPVEYGERMSSVISMRTRRPAQEMEGRVSLGFVNAAAMLAAPVAQGRGDWLVSGRRSLFDQIARRVEPDVGEPVLIDAMGRFQYRLRDDALLSIGALAADDAITLPAGGGTERFEGDSDRKYLWTAFERRWSTAASRTLLTHTTGNIKRAGWIADSSRATGTLQDDRRMKTTQLRQDWTLPLARDGALRWGAAMRRDRASFDYARDVTFPSGIAQLYSRPETSRFAIRARASLDEYEAWLGASRAAGESWLIEVGAHWSHVEYSGGRNDSAVDPRFAVLGHLSPQTRIRLSWGRMRQRWRAIELPVEIEQRELDTPGSSTMTVLAVEHEFSPRLSVRAEAFDKRVLHPRARRENLLDPIVLQPELRGDGVLVAPSAARVHGIDVHATGQFTERLNGWLSYSWSDARDIVGGTEIPRSWDQRHALGVGLALDYRRWRFSALLTARSDWPLTPLLAGGSTPALTLGARNSVRDGLFATLDLEAEHHIELRNGRLGFSFELTNATNRRNLCCRDVAFDPLARVEDEHWLPLLPLATVSWEF